MTHDEYHDIVIGLHQLQRAFDRYSQALRLKFSAMHRAYFQQTEIEYSDDERFLCDHYLNATLHKFHMAGLALEQLWALSYDTRGDLWLAIEQSLDKLDVRDSDLALLSFGFDTFLFHARAYLEFFMLYVTHVLKTGQEGSVSNDRFFRRLEQQANQDLIVKTERVSEYFRLEVFGEPTQNGLSRRNWGTLLTELRDKIAHRDVLRPTFESQERLLASVLFNWPTIQATTLERFNQEMQNGMFCLVTDMADKLLDREWIAGPYLPGMFGEEH